LESAMCQGFTRQIFAIWCVTRRSIS